MNIQSKMKGGVTTRSMAKKSPREQTARTAQTKQTRTKRELEVTKEQCYAFIDNPFVNPTTGASIDFGGPTYMKLIDKCIEMVPTIHDDILMALMDNPEECLLLVNSSKPKPDPASPLIKFTGDMNSFLTVRHPVTKKDVPLTDDIIKKALYKCASKQYIFMPHFQIGRDDKSYVVPFRVKIHEGRTVIVGLHEILRYIAVNLIDKWAVNYSEYKQEIEDLIEGLRQILGARAAEDREFEIVDDMFFELQAILEGIRLQKVDDHDSDSSSMNSDNRSVSRSPNSLPPLSKKSRQAILDELREACIDMRDMISLDEFEDMKKKKLQLVVKIGPKNKEGQQRCYYVKNIYDYINSSVKQGLVPKDPISKAKITDAELNEVILPKMRYINRKAKISMVQKKEYPRVTLIIKTVNDPVSLLPYYELKLRRHIGAMLVWEKTVGYIPGYVSTASADVNSTVVIAKIRELFDNGRLMNETGLWPRVHLNKSIAFWKGPNVVQKLVFMMDELNTL